MLFPHFPLSGSCPFFHHLHLKSHDFLHLFYPCAIPKPRKYPSADRPAQFLTLPSKEMCSDFILKKKHLSNFTSWIYMQISLLKKERGRAREREMHISRQTLLAKGRKKLQMSFLLVLFQVVWKWDWSNLSNLWRVFFF